MRFLWINAFLTLTLIVSNSCYLYRPKLATVLIKGKVTQTTVSEPVSNVIVDVYEFTPPKTGFLGAYRKIAEAKTSKCGYFEVKVIARGQLACGLRLDGIWAADRLISRKEYLKQKEIYVEIFYNTSPNKKKDLR